MMTDHEPPAALAAWLDDDWQHTDDCAWAGIAWGHLCGHVAHFGTWQQNHCPNLDDFPSSWDAWAFIVATTGIDPLASCPDSVKGWTKRPQPDTLAEAPLVEKAPVQWAMFRKE